LITLANKSGGPLLDIVPSQKVGYLADDIDSYTNALIDIFMMNEAQHTEMQENARNYIESKFSEVAFAKDFTDNLFRVSSNP
jgi:hypothetical protein